MLRILMFVIVLGLIWWLVTFLPLGEPFLTIARVVIVLALIWEVLALAGMVPSALRWPSTPPP